MPNNPPESELNVRQTETMDLNRLRTFVRVLDQGSFTAAARALGLPKSSVSKAVRQLETALGIQLIQRSSRSVRATDAGSALHAAIKPALLTIVDSVTSTVTRGVEPSGRVRVSCPPDFDELMADYVAKFARRHPRVEVDVSLTVRNVDLVAEGYDLALRGGNLRDSSLVVRGAVHSEFGLFAAPEYLKRAGRPHRLSDLHDHTCVGVNVDHHRAVWKLAADGEPSALTVACQLTTDDMRLAVRLARNGVGIALLPLVTVQGSLRHGLTRVLPKYATRNVTLRLVTPSLRLEPMSVRLFREGLLREPWLRAGS
jgi:DNA-binding transcriptional LysR family regulator